MAHDSDEAVRVFAIFRIPPKAGSRYGRLAQLVQSAALTRRRSLVRSQQRPLGSEQSYPNSPIFFVIVAIASKRPPKVEATRRVVERLRQYLTLESSPIEYLAHEIDGGVVMPRTIEQLLSGAKARVENLERSLHAQNQIADYFVGLEGGFHSVRFDNRELVFLQSWAYVSDGKRGYFGSSGNVVAPQEIADEIMKKGRDLSDVIDEVAQQVDVRSNQGTWGILTRGLVTRQQSFETALLAAFAPFYNGELYR